MIKILILSCLALGILASTAGYKIGEVESYDKLDSYSTSTLYQVNVKEIDDGLPMKLIEIVAENHREAGEHYGALLAPQIVDIYHKMMDWGFEKEWQQKLLGMFLDWQYKVAVSKQIPRMFKEELAGIKKGASKVHNIHNVKSLMQRVLTLTSYPGDFAPDIIYTLLDEFLRTFLPLRTQGFLNIIEANLPQAARFISKFIKQRAMGCSFFATWGKRTKGGNLYTMRNLDWNSDIGVNQYKLITVWKIKGTIPHTTVAFPGVLGAITGMSKAGLTVHEAGLDSYRETEHGFQWTLRLRYILMEAQNLQEARQIWRSSNNTLGMNHMVASAADVPIGKPAFAVETMRNYTAWFQDKDQREDGTIFTDNNTKYRAGFAMKNAIFRTNHAYDPKINKYRISLPGEHSSSMQRYFVMKDDFISYEKADKLIGEAQALNMTANVAHKGGDNPYECPKGKDNGTTIISVMFVPRSERMYVGFEYGSGENWRTACCGVYTRMEMSAWFS